MTTPAALSDRRWKIKLAGGLGFLLLALVAVFSSMRELIRIPEYSNSPENPADVSPAPSPREHFRSTIRAGEAVWKPDPLASAQVQAALESSADPAAPAANLDAARAQAQARQLKALQERAALSQDDLDADLTPEEISRMQQAGVMAW